MPTDKVNDRLTDRNLVYTNRELSWLQFNARVLEESEDPQVPLYERLRFLAIFQSNLDEFYMVRVGSLFDQTLLKETVLDSKTQMTATEQLYAIYRGTRALLARKGESFCAVAALLKEQGIEHVALNQLSPEDGHYLERYFEREIRPLISPQIVDKRYPFPFLKNKEIYVGVQLQTKTNAMRVGLIPASGYFARMIFLPGGCRFVLVEDLILLFAERVFDRYQILDKTLFRITRNADIDVEDQMIDVDFDYRDAMEVLLKKRRKLAPVRLELGRAVRPEFADYFCKQLTLVHEQIFIDSCPLDLSFVFALEDKVAGRKELFYQPLTSQMPDQIHEKESMIAQILKKDLLFHYPYHSINPFIGLLREAAVDPDVVSIKITLYRVAKNSRVVNALIAAAENGKDVHVVVELRARFDEENNIDWSKRLEESGCNVIYGLPEYKVHSKLLLITRKHGDGVQYITQIGTGNYNEKTATLYTDLSMMTARPEIGTDASVVFNSLFMGALTEDVNHLLVAPLCFKPQIIRMIDQEMAYAQQGQPARIILKMNSVTDKILIDKLIEASCAGVQITMLVRGICCFKPQVIGFTENIEIFSIVGRFLEHSRILIFGVGDRQKIYISSADFMTRNTERRVEVATPILDPDLKQQVLHLMDVMLSDNQKLRMQKSNGQYVHRKAAENEPGVHAQDALYAEAYEQAAHAKEQSAQPPTPEKPVSGWTRFWRKFFGRSK